MDERNAPNLSEDAKTRRIAALEARVQALKAEINRLQEMATLLSTTSSADGGRDREEAQDESTAEDHSQAFQQYLKALHDITVELAPIENLPKLCRRAIELACERLGFERIGLFLIDEDDPAIMTGAFGIDPEGQIRDERANRDRIEDNDHITDALADKVRFRFWEDTPLWDESQIIGQGWNGIAMLWNGDEGIGWLVADNLLTQAPLLPYQPELLSLYATALGYLITNLRSRIALRESETQYRTLFETIEEGVILIAPDGRIVQANPAAERLLGLSRPEIEARNFTAPEWEIVRPDGTPMPPEEMAGPRAMQEQVPVHDVRMGVKRPDGSVSWLSVSASPLFQDGVFAGVVGTFTDITGQEQAQESLWRSKALLEQAQRMANMASWEWDLATDRSTVSDDYYRIWGIDPTDAPQISEELLCSVLHPDDVPKMRATFQHASDNALSNPTEYRVIDPDGAVRTVFVMEEVVFDANNQPSHRAGFVQDITERKQIEEALRESEERYRLINGLISDFAFSCRVEPDGHWWTEWSTEESFERLSGYRSEELNNSVRLYHADDAQKAQQDIQETIQGKTTGGEYRIITKGGDLRWLYLQREPVWDDKENRVVRFLGIAQDITERKLIEEALRETADRLDLALTGANMGEWTYDVPSQIFSISPQRAETPGYFSYRGGTEFPRNSWPEWIHPDDLEAVYQAVEAHISGEADSIDVEFRMKYEDDQWRWSLNRGKIVLRDENGAPLRIAGTTMDINMRKQMEQEQMALSLERERIQILANFITQASHEFRTPLSTINTSAYLLGKLDDAQARKTHTLQIRNQVQNITTLVNALITLSKLDGGLAGDFIRIDLNALVQGVGQVHKQVAAEKSIALNLETDSGALPIRGDQEYLKQALECVIDNAIRFTTTGGTVTVCTECIGSDAVIEISDTGEGIDADDLPRIFERFFRSDKAGTTRGFGLGLAIARTVIEQHQGSIEVSSQVGEGSTFRIRLPIAI